MNSDSLPWKQLFASNHKFTPVKALQWLALAALFSFALVFWLSEDLGRACEVAAWIALIVSAPQIWRQDRGEWLWLLMIGWLIFMAAVNLGAIIEYPQFESNHLSFTRYYFRLFLFLMAGWWLAGNPRAVSVFLALAALGLFLAVFFNAGPGLWDRLFAGRRVDFAFRNAQHTAVLFSPVLLGTLCFWKRFFMPRGWLRPAGILAWLTLTAFSLLIVISTQTRQIYPAFFACLCATGIWAVYELRRRTLRWSKIGLYTGAAGMALLLAIVLFNPFQGVLQRFENEKQAISQLMNGEITDLPARGGVGIRIRQWRFAVEKFMQAPLTGHGGATKHLLIAESDMPDHVRNQFGHFHNGYLEMGVAYGIFGLLMLPLLIFVLASRLLRAWQAQRVPADFMLFGILSLVFFAVVNLFESYPMYRTGYFFMGIIGGSIYTLTRNPQQ